MTLRDEDVELHAWPPHRYGGQHANGPGHGAGVLAIHRPTGIAAVSLDERSQMRNKHKAVALLRELVERPPLPSASEEHW